MSKGKTWYKVVSKDGAGNCCSASVTYELYGRHYDVGCWTKPYTGTQGLFIFNSLEAARDFASPASRDRIYECKVKRPRKIHYVSYYRRDIGRFWLYRKYKVRKSKNLLYTYRGGYTIMPAPAGSYIADEVMLVKEVECG